MRWGGDTLTLEQKSFHSFSLLSVGVKDAVVVADAVGVEFSNEFAAAAAGGVVTVRVETDNDVNPSDSDDDAVSSDVSPLPNGLFIVCLLCVWFK